MDLDSGRREGKGEIDGTFHGGPIGGKRSESATYSSEISLRCFT